MIARKCLAKIIDSLKKFPVVGLVGSRQVGKTTLSRLLNEQLLGKGIVYLDLERPSDFEKIREPELYLESVSDKLVVLDEIQRKPDLFPLLRALVDNNRVNARFLILGSASPDLIKHSSESLAGRIIYHELSPLLMDELGDRVFDINMLWLRGGYPLSFLAESNSDSFSWREAFIQTYIERDIPQLGIRIPASTIHRFWMMLAHCHGQLWNASKIAESLGVTAPSVRHYLDILQDTYMIRQLQPYFTNKKKRLVKSPKVYIRDSGLLHSLLGIEEFDDLQAHPVIGSSWEGFVMEQIIGIVPKKWAYFFYRTNAGAEIDLVLFPPGGNKAILIEIKYSLTPRPKRGFWNVLEDISYQTAYIIYPGKEKYPIKKDVFVLPLSEINQIFL